MKSIEGKVHEIARLLASRIEISDIRNSGIGLYTGKLGLLLFFAHYAKLFPDAFNRQILDRYIEECCNDLCNDVIYSYTFCSGLSGAMSSIRLMSELSLIDLDISEIEAQYKPIMLRQMKAFLCCNPGNYDFMHGALGIALHYRTDADFVDMIVSWLDENANRDDGITKWKSILNDKGKIGYNIALSHGMSSVILVLCRLYDAGIKQKQIEELVSGTMGYILSQEIDRTVYGCCFPSQSTENGDDIYKSRLGWCYGDLGIAIALWQAGKTFNRQDWIQKAMDVMLFSTQRRDLKYNSINDAGLCHGSSGVAMMFKYMYDETRNEHFAQTAQYWANATIDLAIHTEGPAGYMRFTLEKDSPWKPSYTLLEGIAGIGMSLMSIFNIDQKSKWTELFLL